MLPSPVGTMTADLGITNEISTGYQTNVVDSGEVRSLAQLDEDPNCVKICRVCGDKAISNNFGVIACESCKAFFRRTIPRANEIQCAYGGNCRIDVNTRRQCQKCRLQKCYEVGMAPDNAQKRRRRRLSDDAANNQDLDDLMLDDRTTRVGRPELDGDKTTFEVPYRCQVGADNESVSVAIRLSDKLREKVGEHLAHSIQELVQAALMTAAPDDPAEGASSDYVAAVNADAQTGSGPEEGRIGLNALQRKRPADDSVDQNKHTRSFNHSSQPRTDDAWQMQRCVNDFNSEVAYQLRLYPFCDASFGIEYEDLATIEVPSLLPTRVKHVKLEELLMASEQMRNWKSGFPPLQGVTLETHTLTDVYNMVYFLHTYAINQHRRLTSFKALPSVDKVALFKVRIAEVVLVRLSVKHNMITGQTEIGYPGSPMMTVDLCKKMGGDYSKETTRFKHSFPDNFRDNESIYVILCALALFNPDDVQLEDKGAVNVERRLYLALLKECLESTLDTREALWAYKYLTTWLNALSLWARARKLHSIYDIDQSTLAICKVTLNGWAH